MPENLEEHNQTTETNKHFIAVLFGPAAFITSQLPLTLLTHVSLEIITIAATAPTNGWLYVTILWKK